MNGKALALCSKHHFLRQKHVVFQQNGLEEDVRPNIASDRYADQAALCSTH